MQFILIFFQVSEVQLVLYALSYQIIALLTSTSANENLYIVLCYIHIYNNCT